MKRLFRNIVIWISTVMLVIANTLPIYAATENDFTDKMELVNITEEKLDDGNVLVTELYEESNDEGFQPFTANKSRSAIKRSYIKTSKGTVLVQMRLNASFRYNGTSSYCTNAIAKVEKCSKPYTITKRYSERKSNKAYGYFTILKNGKNFITKVLTITCSKTGTLS